MKFGRILYCQLIISISLVSLSALGQNDHIRFKRITINDGLSLSSVYTIYQDSKGFMWFGTEDGLNKFDGNTFKIFRPEPGKSNSLAYKWTESIYEDSRGHLWFGSKGGLTNFDPEHELFTRYNIQDTTHLLLGDTITCLTEDNRKKLWVGTFSGINTIDLLNNKVEIADLEGLQIYVIISLDEGDMFAGTNQGVFIKKEDEKNFHPLLNETEDISPMNVYSIVQDEYGAVWIGIGNSLYRYSNTNSGEKLESIIRPLDFGLQIDQIEKLLIDKYQNIWMSCSNGLFKYNNQKKQIIPIVKSIDSSHSLAINSVKSIHLDAKNNLWYGTFGDGVYRIDIKTGRFVNFQNNPASLQSLSENSINCIFEDGDENIWFGTFGAGINIYIPQAHKFGFMSHQPLNENSLSSNFIWSIMECENGLLCLGTNDGGMNIYNPDNNIYHVFKPDPNDLYSISHSSVRKVYQDSKQQIWVGTDGGGLNRFYPESGRFINFQTIPGDAVSISSNSVRVIYEAHNRQLWVGTRKGLNLFNPDKGIFTRFLHDDNDPESISNDFIYSVIYQDANDNLWIGTYGGGLNRMDFQTGKFRHYVNDPKNPWSLSDNIVFSIYEESASILWIGTNNGLNKFDSSNGKFERFGTYNGLPNDVIYGILPDENNNIWLSTNKGICRFNIHTFKVKNFTTDDGLQSNEFNGGAFYKGKSGLLYFGGVYGLNIIDPSQDYIDENRSKVVLTKLEVLGHEVGTLSDSLRSQSNHKIIKSGEEYFLPKNISYTDEIVLDYKERFFSIEFAALNSPKTENLNYYYFMDGLDQSWNDAGNRNFVTFANMSPGSYTLSVRSINADGIQGLSSAELKIIITPPLWKTWWFYMLEAVIFISLIVFVYRYLLKVKTNRLLKIQNDQINLTNLKLMESESNLKQLVATKDKFFSIISHDLKNPFTSLLSISQLMADDYANVDEEEKEQGIKRIHNSAIRIYQLLENLLTWSTTQTKGIKFVPINFELGKIIHDNMLLLQESANKKNVQLEVNISNGAMAFGDPEMISAVVRNLLGNAIKFSHEDKSVKITLEPTGAFWKVNISDEGVGIDEENLEKIFQIDTKFKTDGTAGEKGTGLGLIICKEFIEKNKGNISVSINKAKGCTFSFTIPIASNHIE